MKDIKDIQHISYQGIEGSYSHSLARKAAPHAHLTGFPTFEEAAEAVERGASDLAIIPIENNIGGRVAEIHHLLFDTELKIVGEYFHTIDHCLLGAPGSKEERITTIYSHPQALLQCREFIYAHRYRAIPELDTALAAKKIAHEHNREAAAIASITCAEIYNLQVLHTDIANTTNNITRFIALHKEMLAPSNYQHPITALIFQLRSVPAALYKALGGFATNGINMLKLESYVDPGGFDIVYFYTEIAADMHAESSAHALEELSYFAEWVKIIGIFEQNRMPLT